MARLLPPECPATVAVRMLSAADVTGGRRWRRRRVRRATRWGGKMLR